MSSRFIIKFFLFWLPFAVVVTVACGVSYVLVQQSLRMSANDPQIQMAEDAAARLQYNAATPDVVPSLVIDMAKSLAPYVVIYNDTGGIVVSSATIYGTSPILPKSVFQNVRQHGGEVRFTWEPQPGVRQAVVITHFGGKNPGYVLAGRSLREVEIRENNAQYLAIIGEIVGMGATFITCFLYQFIFQKKN